jgi:hypothetical protein
LFSSSLFSCTGIVLPAIVVHTVINRLHGCQLKKHKLKRLSNPGRMVEMGRLLVQFFYTTGAEQ